MGTTNFSRLFYNKTSLTKFIAEINNATTNCNKVKPVKLFNKLPNGFREKPKVNVRYTFKLKTKVKVLKEAVIISLCRRKLHTTMSQMSLIAPGS